jgi:hypothetical protein
MLSHETYLPYLPLLYSIPPLCKLTALSKASFSHTMSMWCGRWKIPWFGKSVGSGFLSPFISSHHRPDMTEITLLWRKATINQTKPLDWQSHTQPTELTLRPVIIKCVCCCCFTSQQRYFSHIAAVMWWDEMRGDRNPEPTLLPTKGIFHLPHHIDMVWEKLAFDNAVSLHSGGNRM